VIKKIFKEVLEFYFMIWKQLVVIFAVFFIIIGIAKLHFYSDIFGPFLAGGLLLWILTGSSSLFEFEKSKPGDLE